MDECFTLHVHHGGHFTWDPQAYVGGTVDIVDNCDPDKWSKVEIESICRDFGYTAVDKLWFKMPGVNLEQAHFHEVVDDDAAVFMTDLVKGYGDIHVFVEHPVNEPVELPVEDLKPLVVRPPGSEPKGVNEDVVYCISSDSELQSDHFYEYAEYEEDNENDDGEYRADFSQFRGHDNAETNNVDEEYRPDFSQFGGHDNAETTNVDHGEQVWARRVGKAPVVDDQVKEISEAEGSDLEEEPHMQPIDIGEDSTDSWDNQAEDDDSQPGQMGGGVMNSDYDSEELLSLDESSSSSEHCEVSSSDGETPTAEVDNSIRRSRYPIFRPVAKAENLRFEKDMLFLSPKQFKDAITDYAVHGGWGIKFVKNDLVRVRAQCQPGCKFVAYLAKVPREKSYRLKTLNMTHTCTRSYRNPRCTASYIGKKLMKRVRRQPDIRLKDIQNAVHEKYVVDISAGKASRAREKAQEAVDGAHTAQFNQLWEYCDELRRCSLGSTVLMKVHTYNDAPYQEETFCRPKKKRALEPDKPRSHRAGRVVGISKQCKTCEKLGHNKRSCKGEIGGNSSLPRSASQVSKTTKTTRRAAKDGHANSPVVGSAQPSSIDDVTTTAPPPPTDNQSNPRPKSQRKRSAVTIETLHASRNATRYMAAMRSVGRSVQVCVQGSAGGCAVQVLKWCSAGVEVV
nr:hypothetical protein CFP56_59061 [Quercus suber]